MTRQKEQRLPPAAGKGRPKGAVNKTTSLLRDSILKAGENAGNRVGNEGLVSYLALQARENPVAFMMLLGKVLPLQVTGDPEEPVQQVTRIILAPMQRDWENSDE